MDRSTIIHTIGEVRPLLVERGCTVSSDARLRPLAEAIDRLDASGTTSIIGGTEIRVRRPAAGRKDRDTFISDKGVFMLLGVRVFDGVPGCGGTGFRLCAHGAVGRLATPVIRSQAAKRTVISAR
ncbi:hypothetical protein [Streptomyces sp. NPDC057052]|uniref:hypothetical protein n=1 Tax=Streptomyces sp. NPDC057052 TaxID=3346010 RepID=UPI003643CB8A